MCVTEGLSNKSWCCVGFFGVTPWLQNWEIVHLHTQGPPEPAFKLPWHVAVLALRVCREALGALSPSLLHLSFLPWGPSSHQLELNDQHSLSRYCCSCCISPSWFISCPFLLPLDVNSAACGTERCSLQNTRGLPGNVRKASWEIMVFHKWSFHELFWILTCSQTHILVCFQFISEHKGFIDNIDVGLHI